MYNIKNNKNKKNINNKKNKIKHSSNILNNIITILDILRWTISQFSTNTIYCGHGTDNVWDEARYLILTFLNLPINIPTQMYNAKLTITERISIIKLVMKRIHMRIPVPYLINQAWFCGLKFYVDKRVFIPRSPIGEIIKNNLNKFLEYSPGYILDLCTGSGCIAIALAKKYPKAQIDAIDITNNALQVTEYNIQLHNMEKKIIPICSDLFYDAPPIQYDLIVSNPPYVKDKEIKNLPQELKTEPKLAFTAGHDGLKIIKRILSNSSYYLNKNGILICEVGHNKTTLSKLYPNIPFYWVPLKHGGQGIFILNRKQLIKYKKFFN